MLELTKFRREMGWDPKRDAELEELLSEVIDLWESQTFRLWNQRTGYVETISSREPKRTVFLELWPITTITKVEERGRDTADWTDITNTEDTTYYVQIGDHGIERLSTSSLKGDKKFKENVRVTYDGGYAKAPLDVQMALIVQAKFMAERFEGSKVYTKSQNFEGGAGVFEAAHFHPYFQRIAKQYRRWA